MSYVSQIPSADLPSYSYISDWNNYYQSFKKHFRQQNPTLDFSKVKLTVEERIFPSDVVFSGEYECSIEFINCYFQGTIAFEETNIKENIFFRQCFCDYELTVVEKSIFEMDFNIADLTI